MPKISIKWSQTRQFSKRLNSNREEFKNIYENMKKITESLDDVWTGQDETNFKKSFLEFLKTLEDDYEYMGCWSSTFDRSSNRYSDAVAEGVAKMNSVITDYSLPNTIELNNMAGVSSYASGGLVSSYGSDGNVPLNGSFVTSMTYKGQGD